MKNYKIFLLTLSVLLSPNIQAKEESQPIVIKTPSLQTYLKERFEDYVIDESNTSIQKEDFVIKFKAKNVKRKRGDYNFNINYDVSLTDDGFYNVTNGNIDDANGFTKFNFNVEKKILNSNYDFVDILENSNKFSFTSYSSKKQSDLLPIMGIKMNLEDTMIYETLVLEKNSNDILGIKKAELRVGNDLIININGNYNLVKGLFNNGFINVDFSDKMYLYLKENGFKIDKKSKNIDLKGKNINKIINSVFIE